MKRLLPSFQFHTDPVKTKAIIKKKTVCPVCEQSSEYQYQGPFYSREDVSGICPWCIKDGSAAKKFDGSFVDGHFVAKKVSKEDLDELVHRTPSYTAWQSGEWQVHCGRPGNFLGYVGWKDIENKQDELAGDIHKQAEGYGLSVDEFSERLINNGHMQGYLFECVDCGCLMLTTDMS